MILIMGTVRIDPATIAVARPAMAAMVAASNAEDGCEAYAYSQDLLDPGLIHISERWRDRDALAGHFQTPHMAQWRAAIPGLGISDRNLKLYESDGGEAI
ncbi:MAG: putative quinol monooxygenase [Novosphingobium sp.]